MDLELGPWQSNHGFVWDDWITASSTSTTSPGIENSGLVIPGLSLERLALIWSAALDCSLGGATVAGHEASHGLKRGNVLLV